MSDIVYFWSNGRQHMLLRPAYNAWVAAGSPPIEDAGRYYERQKYYYDGWKAGKPGFNPADNPDSTTQELGHVRFVAVDLTHRSDIARMKARGWVFPFSWEWWHCRLPNVYNYPLIKYATTNPNYKEEEEEMAAQYINLQGKANSHRGGTYAIMRSNASSSQPGILFARFVCPTPTPGYPTIPAEEFASWNKTMPFG